MPEDRCIQPKLSFNSKTGLKKLSRNDDPVRTNTKRTGRRFTIHWIRTHDSHYNNIGSCDWLLHDCDLLKIKLLLFWWPLTSVKWSTVGVSSQKGVLVCLINFVSQDQYTGWNLLNVILHLRFGPDNFQRLPVIAKNAKLYCGIYQQYVRTNQMSAFTKLQDCPQCGKTYNTYVNHRCPSCSVREGDLLSD